MHINLAESKIYQISRFGHFTKFPLYIVFLQVFGWRTIQQLIPLRPLLPTTTQVDEERLNNNNKQTNNIVGCGQSIAVCIVTSKQYMYNVMYVSQYIVYYCFAH